MGGFDISKRLRITLNIIALIAFLALITYLSVRYTPELAVLFSRRGELKELVESMGAAGIGLFILLQVLQVVVAAIPGEPVQIAGGYLFGTLQGTAYLVAGGAVGSIIVFYASRLLGYGLVKAFAPAKQLERFYRLLNNPKSEITMLVLFLIPGIPKDVLTYLAGLTPVRPGRFLAIAMAGRLPAMAASCYIGANLQSENYAVAITVFAAAAVLFAAGLLFRNRIINMVHRGFKAGRTSL